MLGALFPALTAAGGALGGPPLAALGGVGGGQFACFAAFWGAQLAVLLHGMEGIKHLERWAAPVLIAMVAAIFAWAITAAGGLGPILAAPSAFAPGGAQAGGFAAAFLPALTANLGFWLPLSLNISDFTRLARSQRDQALGQLSLPVFQALFAFVGLAVTSATVVMYGRAISDPIALLGTLRGAAPLTAGLAGLILATLTTNVAANVVAPATALVAINPRLSFRAAALATAALGAVIQPWRLVASAGAFFSWLTASTLLLAPAWGVVVCDYWILRRGRLNVDALFDDAPGAAYAYRNGWNPAALIALGAGAAPLLPGALHSVGLYPAAAAAWRQLYSASWFVGAGVGGAVYLLLMRGRGGALPEQHAA
jgi:NCS1 family nucleobase:cation symporter-1